jgi:hypothetical protein
LSSRAKRAERARSEGPAFDQPAPEKADPSLRSG